ncbi:MAG TPA: hypothetical protein QF753_23135 [Victivallales bacterium]|nr:hypothetical protein [Victivallales bacterium]
MPQYGENQQPTGKIMIHSCDLCEEPEAVTMRIKPKGFKVAKPEYNGNAVLNANRS